MKVKYILPLAIFLLLVLVFSFKLLLKPDDQAFKISPLVGKPIPNFILPTLSGNRIGNHNLYGKKVLINFFASWCETCRFEQPALLALQKESGIDIYGIALKDNDKKTMKWLEDAGNPYSSVAEDHDGRTGIDFGITGVPETFLVGSDGMILFHQRGAFDQESYDKLMKLIR